MNNSKIDKKKLINFLEELSWILSSYSDLDYKKLPDAIDNYLLKNSEAHKVIGGYASENPNKHFLVGVLPRLLNDRKLFNTNEEIAKFAKDVLGIKINRYAKKSRFEIIGHIVCETEYLNDKELNQLVFALAKITDADERTLSIIKNKKEENYNWNRIITELSDR